VFFEARCKSEEGDSFRHFADTLADATRIEMDVVEVFHWSINKDEYADNPILFANPGDFHILNSKWEITKVPFL
jgi:hypothetical protein